MFVNKTTKTKVSVPAPAPIPTQTPQYAFYPHPPPFYNPFYNYNSSPRFTSSYYHSQPSRSPIFGHNNSNAYASIPKIQKFLENLDDEFGAGKFTSYSENFINESIDVLDLLELTEKDFDKLGITNIGIRTKLVRKAKQYCK